MSRCSLGIVLFLLLTVSSMTWAENIFILAPYAGPNTHSYKNDDSGIESEGSGLLTGVYFQMVNPDRFQWNTFLYFSPETNHSRILGGHLIFDYYFMKGGLGYFIAGTGIEYINLKMEAGDRFTPLKDFNLENNIFINYYRAGYKFRIPAGKLRVSVFPWAGFQYDIVKGSLDFDIPAGAMSTMPYDSDINDNEIYAIGGVNFKMQIFRFVDLEAKYRATVNSGDFLSTYSALANVYMNRYMGVTYRFKYSELTSGFERYHLFGMVLAYR